jgi:hypothetical protein
MAHALILGMTLSGKTTLAKRLAATFRANGYKIMALDPLLDPEWNTDLIFQEPDDFLAAYWKNKQCVAFIDEAGESSGTFDKPMIKTATRGRHWGHKNFYLSQRGAMIAKTIRDQCNDVFLFRQSIDDAKVYAREWAEPVLLEAAQLKQGHYIHKSRFGDVRRGQLW